jgi:hypothetical protein
MVFLPFPLSPDSIARPILSSNPKPAENDPALAFSATPW